MTPTTISRSTFGLVAALALVAGCGATTASDTPPTTTENTDDVGGFGAPAAAPGEFDDLPGVTMTGRVDLTDDGCWYLTGNGDRALLITPVGTRLGDDGTSLVTGEGVTIADGDRVDATGGFVETDSLPGGADGRWGNYVAFCAPSNRFVAVTGSIGPAFDPADVDLEALAGDLAASVFTVDRGCGYGFATGDDGQRWALRIDHTPPEPPTASRIVLPDERFEVTVTTGAHLFANHCDDAIEWFEPEPVVAARWPVTAGSFDYPVVDTTTGGCAGESVTTVLTGATVQTPIGPVDLEPIEITNEAFGCFAG
ncbi:MAG: hypothetical protein HKN41_08120 [Ilumatobacter sp.]|nr:hypothetical protein [Ilumatobacter sp.]